MHKSDTSPTPKLTDEALRALAEAEARRKELATREQKKRQSTEVGGVGGPEPTRYGDWEKKGIATDF